MLAEDCGWVGLNLISMRLEWLRAMVRLGLISSDSVCEPLKHVNAENVKLIQYICLESVCVRPIRDSVLVPS